MENISVFDLVVTVLLATATFWGGMRGVVSQVASIATWVLSGLAAARYGSVVGDVVSIPEPWRAPVSALIVFCASLLALSVASRFVKRAVSLAGLKEFDRQAGALFGFFKGCAICVVLTFFCVLASEKTRDLVDDSKSGPYLASVALVLKGSFPESETMTRFETLVGTMESTQAKGGGTPSLNSEIAALETYLKNEVLLPEAEEVVEEAESGKETANSGASSLWSRFANDLRGLSGSSGSKSANAAGNSSADVGAASGTVVGNAGAERTNAANGGNGARWNVWGSRADDGARGGATNDGY
ncbi:MAG: CvpA family protein, partial [Thermoguttaceae bacterium]|nr:CvpA family protein [Thermoguttaceae bacterium]